MKKSCFTILLTTLRRESSPCWSGWSIINSLYPKSCFVPKIWAITSRNCQYHCFHGIFPGFSLPVNHKESIGLQRGKNDRIDAKRIANYAVLHYRKLKLYKLPDKELVKLRGGIGVINTIVFDNFQRFDNPRKFACYCGVPHLNILQVFPYEEKHRHLH